MHKVLQMSGEVRTGSTVSSGRKTTDEVNESIRTGWVPGKNKKMDLKCEQLKAKFHITFEGDTPAEAIKKEVATAVS